MSKSIDEIMKELEEEARKRMGKPDLHCRRQILPFYGAKCNRSRQNVQPLGD